MKAKCPIPPRNQATSSQTSAARTLQAPRPVTKPNQSGNALPTPKSSTQLNPNKSPFPTSFLHFAVDYLDTQRDSDTGVLQAPPKNREPSPRKKNQSARGKPSQ